MGGANNTSGSDAVGCKMQFIRPMSDEESQRVGKRERKPACDGPRGEIRFTSNLIFLS